MMSQKTFLVCISFVVFVICDARTIKENQKETGRKSGHTSVKNKGLWPFTATIKCDLMDTLDTDYNSESEKKKDYKLESVPNCGLDRFSSRSGDSKVKRHLRGFQEYLAELELSLKEDRQSRKQRSRKNLDKGGRIVGGELLKPGTWPWLAAVGKYTGTPFCGATVISKRWLVTAAHCFGDKVRPCRYTVRVGATNWLTDPDNLSEDSQVEAVYRHPGYVAESHENDIALIKLAEPLMLDSDTNINAICLPEKGRSVKPGTTLHAAGWGLQGDGMPSTESIESREVSIPLIGYDGTQCGEYPDEMILKGMICAGVLGGGKDTCQGDSGGPLTYKKDGRWHLLGATSFGVGCAQKGYPGVYTDVGQYRDWIASCIARHS